MHHYCRRTRAWQNPCMDRSRVYRWLPLLLALLCCAGSAFAQAAPQRVLIFSKTTGWRHDSIPTAVAALQKLVAEQGMASDHSEDAGDFTAANLARYRVVVFANTTGDLLDDTQQTALQGFLRGGGGYMGVHSAADTEKDWPWYGELVGALFDNHPPGLQSTQVQPERDGTPAGRAWPITDELYNYRRNPRPHVQVSATVDEREYEGGDMGADHPIAWCRPFEGGRTWYTGLGHHISVYENRDFTAQLVRGLRYAAGKSDDC